MHILCDCTSYNTLLSLWTDHLYSLWSRINRHYLGKNNIWKKFADQPLIKIQPNLGGWWSDKAGHWTGGGVGIRWCKAAGSLQPGRRCGALPAAGQRKSGRRPAGHTPERAVRDIRRTGRRRWGWVGAPDVGSTVGLPRTGPGAVRAGEGSLGVVPLKDDQALFALAIT